MKLMRLPLAFLLFFSMSCSTDFDINGKWEDITIVYGLLNQDDSISYVKINKAFLGDGDVLTMAQMRDSCEYPYPMQVRLEEWSNKTLAGIIYFDTTTVNNKESGQFYSPSQTLYKAVTYHLLNLESTYKIVVVNPKTGKIITGQTVLVYPFEVTKPRPSEKTKDFSLEGVSAVEWNSAKNGRRYQLMIRFNYKELPVSGGNDTVFKSVDWLFPSYKSTNINGGEEMRLTYSNPFFYELIKSKITANPNLKRFVGKKGHSETDFGAIEFIFSVASDELSTYLDVYEPSNGLIQEKPDYTNIENGLGIFSSRSQVFRTFKLNDLTKARIIDLNLGF
ncbi:MAG: hypothetical protein NTU44_07875 [Bacteroidetes bacterium]|nr:hypothetical protein [Bacteroidota bacterium]